jgi:hypothetical protein
MKQKTKAELWAEFYREVAIMRKLQQLYFRNRGASTLQDSKAAEKRVDALLIELKRGEVQTKLF